MKIKNMILILPLLLCSCEKKKMTLYLGESIANQENNFLLELENNFSCSINNEFTSTKFYMKSFYTMLEKNALNLTTNNSLITLLKNTNHIILNVGNYEIIRLISYGKSALNYDEEVIKTSLEMFDYYLHNSLEILTNYTENITIIPLYNSLMLNEEDKAKYNTLINKYNQTIFNNCNEFNIRYVNIDKLSYFVYQDNTISTSGTTYLIKQINKAYESN